MQDSFPVIEEISEDKVEEKVEEPTEDSEPDINSAPEEKPTTPTFLGDSDPGDINIEIIDKSGMTFDTLFSTGRLVARIRIGKRLEVKFKSLTADESLEVESRIRTDSGHTYRYWMNKTSVGHLEYALMEINGRSLPDNIKEKREVLGSMAVNQLNLLIEGYRKFTAACDKVVEEGDLGNF